tara:strand:- start:356 stop:577 length:222 start_codon:yes stop_codon:yes gene_type:complete
LEREEGRERQNKTFSTKEVKKESLKESLKERENLKRTSTTTVDWMDCILLYRGKETDENSLRCGVEKVKERER